MKSTKQNHPRAVRRAAVFGVLGATLGSSLPKQWVKPVIASVVLPAHAMTSDEATTTEAPVPLVAVLNGVVEGAIGTNFTADASASTGPAGAVLSYSFSVEGNCELLSQTGATAVIERGLINGNCLVRVVVSDGSSSDTATVEVAVTGGPPGTP